MKKIILYDDYNRQAHRGGVIGTVVQQFSRTAWKNGWKIIEVYETDDDPTRRRQGGGKCGAGA